MRLFQKTGLAVPIVLILILLGIGIAAFGTKFYREQTYATQTWRNGELRIIADLKAGQIEAWRQARIAEGDAIRANPSLVSMFQRALDGSGLQREAATRDWMAGYKKHRDCLNALLLRAGDAALQSGEFRRAVETQTVVLSDVHRRRTGNGAIDLVVPILRSGILLIEIDPAVSLFPLLKNWPLPASTGKFLLLSPESADAAPLNEPLQEHTAAAILKAVPPGPRALGSGWDDRGVPFVAATRPIPGSPWILAASMARQEIYGSLRQSALWIALIGTLLFIAAASSIALLLREQQARFLRRQQASKCERQALAARLDALSRYSNDIILLTDPGGRILEANDCAILTYRYDRDELLRLAMSDLLPPAGRPALQERWERIMEEGGTVFEAEQQSKDLSVFPVEISVRVVVFDGNMCCQCIIHDVSLRKAAQERSRLLEAAILQIGDGVAIVEARPEYACRPEPTFMNHAMQRLTGYTLKDLQQGVGALLDARAGDGGTRHEELQKRCAPLGRCPTRFEAAITRKDGTQFDAEWDFAPLRDESGAVTHCIWMCRDITGRKRAEESLRFLSSIVQSSDDAIISKDMSGIILSWNSGAQRIYGYTAEEMLGRSIARLIPAGHTDEFPALMKSLKEGRRIEHFETERLTKDNRRIIVSVTISPIKNRENTVVGASVIARDISERKQAEAEILKLNQELEQRVIDRTAQLQESNSELEAFAYSVSHDLRAPLRAVDGFSRILLEEYAPQLPGEAQHFLEIARKNAVQMGELIDGLLKFSRLSRQPLCKQPIVTSDLVWHVWEDLRSEYEGRNVDISVGDLAPCEGDALLLRQVFFNLLSNALKYTRKRDHAYIEVTSTGPSHSAPPVYSVRDNGVGFDVRYIDKLFGVFQRLHRAEDYEGTGVGLATVQRIIHRHGGRIWADSVLNQGATFSFTLASVKRNGIHAA